MSIFYNCDIIGQFDQLDNLVIGQFDQLDNLVIGQFDQDSLVIGQFDQLDNLVIGQFDQLENLVIGFNSGLDFFKNKFQTNCFIREWILWICKTNKFFDTFQIIIVPELK